MLKNSPVSPLRVSCAIIEKEDKVLAVQRSEEMHLPLKWEFPGGKMEEGESEEECIVREIKEELNIEIELVRRLPSAKYDYPNFTIELIAFVARIVGGQIRLREHKDIRYVTKEQLRDLDWAAADVPVVEQYLKL
jgi:8-oxo-dGTP diphosphatase